MSRSNLRKLDLTDEMLERHRAGTASIRKLAREAGVQPSTLSRALKRDDVQARIAAMQRRERRREQSRKSSEAHRARERTETAPVEREVERPARRKATHRRDGSSIPVNGKGKMRVGYLRPDGSTRPPGDSDGFVTFLNEQDARRETLPARKPNPKEATTYLRGPNGTIYPVYFDQVPDKLRFQGFTEVTGKVDRGPDGELRELR